MQEYLKLDKLRTLFNIDDHIFKLYNTLKNSMIIPDDKYFTILYLCPNLKESERAYKVSIKRCKELESLKDRQEKILIVPLKKLESGFDGYRISQIIFFALDGKESIYETT